MNQCVGVGVRPIANGKTATTTLIKDIELIGRERNEKNGAPGLGTQNQTADFILAVRLEPPVFTLKDRD